MGVPSPRLSLTSVDSLPPALSEASLWGFLLCSVSLLVFWSPPSSNPPGAAETLDQLLVFTLSVGGSHLFFSPPLL